MLKKKLRKRDKKVIQSTFSNLDIFEVWLWHDIALRACVWSRSRFDVPWPSLTFFWPSQQSLSNSLQHFLSFLAVIQYSWKISQMVHEEACRVKALGSQTEEGILKGKMSLSSTEVVHDLTEVLNKIKYCCMELNKHMRISYNQVI